jgi:DNA recombination protein RmuC
MQYPFLNGEIVDAAVFVNGKVVPIDSKFSLENYNRLIKCEPSERAAFEKAFVNDLKMRITETAKYIRPAENTMDFAFMFIPSEGIYYDLLTNQVGAGEDENLLQRAASKYKVIIVSPTSFLAYLQTVLLGLNALKIEQRAEEIQKRVGELGKHMDQEDAKRSKRLDAIESSLQRLKPGDKFAIWSDAKPSKVCLTFEHYTRSTDDITVSVHEQGIDEPIGYPFLGMPWEHLEAGCSSKAI